MREPDPVDRISSVFLDLAVEHDLAIVPIRFTGGLTAEPAADKLELPRDHARQDYVIGRPIAASELRGLPYAERRRHVLDAMNGLAPGGHGVRDPRPELAADVAEWSSRTGVGEVEATIYRTLQALPAPCSETRILLDAVARSEPAVELPLDAAGSEAAGIWLASIASRLCGRTVRVAG
jgi:hypothetical protein